MNILILSSSKKIYYLARVIYLSIDPFRQKLIFPRLVDRILHEIIFSTCLSMFLILLLVWHGMYGAFNIDSQFPIKNQMLKKIKPKCECKYGNFKTFICIILIIVYPIQIVFSYLRGTRGLKIITFNGVLFGIMSFSLIFIIIFITYTCRMNNVLSTEYEKQHRVKIGKKVNNYKK